MQAALAQSKAEEERSKWDALALQLKQNSSTPAQLPGQAPSAGGLGLAYAPQQALSQQQQPVTLLPPQGSLQGVGMPAVPSSHSTVPVSASVGMVPGMGYAYQPSLPGLSTLYPPATPPQQAEQEPGGFPAEEEIECVICLEVRGARLELIVLNDDALRWFVSLIFFSHKRAQVLQARGQ